MNKPSKFTAETYGTKISVEVDHSDLSLDEVMDVFQTLIIGMGYHENSFKNWVIERANEYNETDAEDLKEKLEAWKFEDDDIVLRHRYLKDSEGHEDYSGQFKDWAGETPIEDDEDTSNKRMDIIGQNGNEGLHYDKEGVDELLKRYNEPETQKRLNILRDAELGIKGGYRATEEDEDEFSKDGGFDGKPHFEWGDIPEDEDLFEGDEWKANENLKAANERYKKKVKKMNNKKRNNKN